MALAAAAVSLAALFWACRGAPLGVPVADDYTFLATLRFERPLDFLSSMGSPFYWRPLSRQAYYLILGPRIVETPWIPVALHALLLLALFGALFGIARRMLPPSLAVGVAAFPILAEPARVLLGWPSGGEYLLAMVGCALAVHEALAGRHATAALGAAVALLAHEASVLVLPVLPAIAWLRTRRWSGSVVPLGFVALLGLLSWLGHAAAARRGMQVPAGELTWGRVGEAFARAVVAQLGLEDAAGARGIFLAGAWITLALLALVIGLRSAPRARMKAHAKALTAGVLWFAAGTVSLAMLLPDWNGWRTVFPSMGLAIGFIGALALISPRLAMAAMTVRLLALLTVSPAPTVVAAAPPPTTSQLSFQRLTRLQRTVESTRRALRSRHARMPPGAEVRHWWLPHLTEFGFQGSGALRVWYGDSTASWRRLGGEDENRSDFAAIVAFEDGAPWPAHLVEPEAMRRYVEARRAFAQGLLGEADSLSREASRIQPLRRGPFHGLVTMLQGQIAWERARYRDADSLSRASVAMGTLSADYWALQARLALHREDLDAAIQHLRSCLAMDPEHPDARQLLETLGIPP